MKEEQHQSPGRSVPAGKREKRDAAKIFENSREGRKKLGKKLIINGLTRKGSEPSGKKVRGKCRLINDVRSGKFFCLGSREDQRIGGVWGCQWTGIKSTLQKEKERVKSW